MVANFEKLSSLRQRNTDEHNDGNDDPSEMLVASRDIANVDKFNCMVSKPFVIGCKREEGRSEKEFTSARECVDENTSPLHKFHVPEKYSYRTEIF
jgi:hypothetical protein